jgi:predicted metalloprotease with PDZ domain
MYCLLADVEIREKTNNRKTLGDAMRAILDAGGNVTQHWTLERALEIGDKATGTTVLRDLHARMAARAEKVDLNALWTRLGVTYQRGRVSFDESAPLAEVRRSITRGQ